MIRDGPPGSIGRSNGSGWMQATDFRAYIEHFAKHSRPSKEHSVLLLLDNPNSHLDVGVIDFCKQQGIVLFSFPPHCSHRLQPLDRGVYGPLKKFVNSACDSWMRNNARKTMSIHDIPRIVAECLLKAATPSNIAGGFRTSGIFPFNRNIFSEEDFIPSTLSDRPDMDEVHQRTTNTILDRGSIEDGDVDPVENVSQDVPSILKVNEASLLGSSFYLYNTIE